ncbi:hypothetical protein BKA69DRAFT_633166 [Paraphysoderma sedebokerense]|nr:hypothetical protein BKA69DRAFT_633166 [Paraphysoderma sedebokerense]
MWADRLAIFIVFLTRLCLPSLALDSLSSTVADFILPTVHPKLNKRLQRPSLRSPHRKTIGYHLCSLQEEPMLSSHPRLSPNPYTVALEKRHPTRNSSFESSPNLSKLPFAPKMPQSSQFVVSSNPDVLRSKLRNVIENWGSLPNSNLSRLAHYSDDHELELILADPRSIAVESPDSTPKKKHPNRKLDAVIAPPAEDTTSPNLNSDTAVDQPKLSNQKVTSISEDRSFFQTDDRQQVPIVELNSSARGNNAARSMVVPIDAQEEKKKEIDVPDFLSKSLEELRIESLELSRSIEQAKSGLVGEELTMMSQWIKSRIQSFNSRFLSQDAIGLTLLGKAPTAEIVVMYNSTVSNNPRLKSDTFVYLEQVNLGTMNLEMHIPVATNTLNHLLSWTTYVLF